MKYREVFITPESLMHARTHKYIDKIWQNGKWKYIYHDPNKKIDPSTIKQPVKSQNTSKASSSSKSSSRKGSGRSKSSSSSPVVKSEPTLEDQTPEKQEEIKEKGRKFVRTYFNSSGFGRRTIESGTYIKEDSSGREYYYTRNKEGRLIKKYLK